MIYGRMENGEPYAYEEGSASAPRHPRMGPRFIPLPGGAWVVRFYKTDLATGLPTIFEVYGATWREAWMNSRMGAR